MDELPPGYIACIWCGAGNKKPKGTEQTKCFRCGLNPMPNEDPTKEGKVNPVKAAQSSRNKLSAPKQGRLGTKPVGEPIIGVDPGARYTGVVVRDGDVVLHAETLVRDPEKMKEGVDWAILCVAEIERILRDYPITIPMAVEGINDPKGFHHGKQAAINPKDIIRAAIVLGAVCQRWPNAVVVDPGGNGSQHYTFYPPELIGRRPSTLAGSTNGAGTRDHEQSAYDVAGKGARVAYMKKQGNVFGT